MAAIVGMVFIVSAVQEFKAVRMTRKQLRQKPELYFDRIKSAWANDLKL